MLGQECVREKCAMVLEGKEGGRKVGGCGTEVVEKTRKEIGCGIDLPVWEMRG